MSIEPTSPPQSPNEGALSSIGINVSGGVHATILSPLALVLPAFSL
jgi:hypothetical protein